MPDTVPVVLVVDVDPDVHLVAERALPTSECAIVSSRSAEIALKLAERRPPSVLLVGEKVAGFAYLGDRIRRLSPHLHVVVITSAETAMDAIAHRQAGVSTVLRKPFDEARFRGVVRTVLRLAAMSAHVKQMHRAGSRPDLPAVDWAPRPPSSSLPPLPATPLPPPPTPAAAPRPGAVRSTKASGISGGRH